jgi:hypothetical protein
MAAAAVLLEPHHPPRIRAIRQGTGKKASAGAPLRRVVADMSRGHQRISDRQVGPELDRPLRPGRPRCGRHAYPIEGHHCPLRAHGPQNMSLAGCHDDRPRTDALHRRATLAEARRTDM